MLKKTTFLLIFFFLGTWGLFAQKDPLGQGNWVKIGVTEQGVYQLSASQLQNMGFSVPMKTSNIQLYGLVDSVFTEKVPSNPTIQLNELAIKVNDGGDGQFDNNDYLLFYHPGNKKHQLGADGTNWNTVTSLQADTAYYFITVNNVGKRIISDTITKKTAPIANSTTYTHHYFFQTDSVSILNSGKLWLGPAMGQGIGKTPSVNYSVNMDGILWNQPIQLSYDFWSTAYQTPSQFSVQFNGTSIDSFKVANVSGYLYDASALNNLGNNKYVLTKPSTTANSSFQINFQGTSNSTGWIHYFGVHAQRTIGFYDNNQIFFDIKQGSLGDVIHATIENANATTNVWRIGSNNIPSEIKATIQGTSLQFDYQVSDQDYFLANKSNDFRKAWVVEKTASQQLDQFVGSDYIIIAPTLFEKAARQLADFYSLNKKWYQAKVVPVQQIYNVFGSGQVHLVAIRNFLKYLKIQSKQLGVSGPQYVLFMGGGNFDKKHLNTQSQLPVYESDNSNEILNSYTSDDFFACLEDGQNINMPSSIDSLSLAIGRLPVRTVAEADTVVKKIINYQSGNRGAWQRDLIWVADDGDYNLHLQDADAISNNIVTQDPIWNHKKMYLDLYPSLPTSTGNTYPTLINDLKQKLNNGALLLNYTGHGNYLRLSEEAVISSSTMSAWNNANKNPVMVTASCDFGPLDQPQLKPIAWDALMQNSNGIIGLVAASRLVFAYSNKQINDLFAQELLLKQNGTYQTLGKALQNAKKLNWKAQGDKVNALKFNLLGDPAMHLPLSMDSIQNVTLNQKRFVSTDTLQAGTKVVVGGNVFTTADSGWIQLVVFDQPKQKSTLANIASSMVTPVSLQEDVVYKGLAKIINGKFSIEFVLPKEVIALTSGIKMECYANNGVNDAWWSTNQVFVKPSGLMTSNDTLGPSFNAFIRNTAFEKNKSWTLGNEPLYIYLKDTSGIQSSGNVLGHDIELFIDNETTPYVLNQLYVSDVNTYQSGSIVFNLPLLKKGPHQMVLRAWDLIGNMSKDTLFFYTPDSTRIVANKSSIFPNPVNQNSKLSFDLSFIPNNDLVTISIADASGKVIQSVSKQLNASSNFIEIPLENWGINISALGPGIFFCNTTISHVNSQLVSTNKLVKMP
jgi:hypothetical protein